jgi:pyruvate dehydrogenase E2 component (dihydrolipoamide acetyltransferase)
MPITITMPALSPTMTEGTLSAWHKKEGEAVKAGDVIAEIETDKATMEVEAVDEGTLAKIIVPAGTQNVQVNAPIALLLGEGEGKDAIEGFGLEKPMTPPAENKAVAAAPAAPVSAAPVAQKAAVAAVASSAPVADVKGANERIVASPLAKRMANQSGIDLGALAGSGPNGRIVKRDVELAMQGSAPRKPAPAPSAAPTAGAAPVALAAGVDARALADAHGMKYRAEANSSMRRVIARRLTESKQTVPHFYLTIDCVIDKLLAARKELNAGDEALKASVNDFVIRAVALALKQVPAANTAWAGTDTLWFEHADVSVAVATPGGLITPIIKAAETKGIGTIAREMKDLAERARAGKLKPEEFQGGTFSISNLGMYGVKQFEAVINPPQACILAVGAGEPRAIVKDGALGVATVMSCTLSVDHRAVDGAVGAAFLAAFKRLIENPLTMLL